MREPGSQDEAAGRLEITHGEMNAAVDRGNATPLPGYGWVMRYLDGWWVVWEGGWLRVTDQAAARELDLIAARLTEAGEIAAQDAAMRRGDDHGGPAQDAARAPGGSPSGGGNRPASTERRPG